MSFRYEFEPLPENERIKEEFRGYTHGLVRSIPEGWILGGNYGTDHADPIYNFKLRDDDVWVASFPKSGTTWMDLIVWLLLNNLDIDTSMSLGERCPFLDLDQGTPTEKFKAELRERLAKLPDGDPFANVIRETIDIFSRTRVQDADSKPESVRRTLKTHLPFCLLPPEILRRNKVIYVARDPRDVVVSYYHHHKLIRFHDFTGNFEAFFQYFINDKTMWSPYWKHIQQAWDLRNHPNLLFIFYSDMKADLIDVVHRVMSFLGVSYDKEEIRLLTEHVSIDKMRRNLAVDDTKLMIELGLYNPGEGSFVRQGKNGSWKDYFDAKMTEEMEAWIKKNTEGTDLPVEKLCFNLENVLIK